MKASANRYIAVVDVDESVCRSFNRLAGAGHTTPVVFIAAHDNPHVQAEAEANGCSGNDAKSKPAR